ncbi:MAG TPA: energy transducer TonB [Steroidobacteraceae bacterium]|jgi:TonB family protein|nr:energy transducer TonB [Steroidobacteraceae bacterium]
MQTLTSLIAILAAAATAAAEAPAPPGAAPTPQFATSDEVPELSGYEDAFALYEVRVAGQVLSEADQVTRWQDELKAGRARAGALVGSHLAYLALTPGDCAAAREALTRADELGNDQAAFKLAQLAENSSCGDINVAEVERWFKKAVTLDYLVAAQRLIELYSATGMRSDPVQQYIYARVAGGYWEAVYPNDTNTSGRTGFDATALQEMEKTLQPADRKRAETEAAQILTQMLKRHERFTPAHSQEFSRGGQGPKASKGWGFVGFTIDYHHECAWNLAANCRGAQRLAFVDVSNNESDFMSCKADLRAKDLVTGKPGSLPREMLIGPKTTRRLILGDVNEVPDKSAMSVICKVVPKLADNAAAGRCKARLQGTIDAQQFYPAAAQRQNIEGDAVVRYFVAADGDAPVDAEIARSSGYPILDAAAIDTIRSGHFSKECDYGLGSIRIAFKLKE